jgi:Transcriptional antiterminator
MKISIKSCRLFIVNNILYGKRGNKGMVIELDKQFDLKRNDIETVVKNVIDEHHISVSQTSIENLVIHLSLCISRELNGTYIFTSESQLNQLKEHEYYSIAEIIVKNIEKKFDVTIDTNQICYVTMYLANINLLDIDFHCEFDLFDDDMENIMKKTLQLIKEKLNLDLKKNENFYSGMTLHFYPALERLQNDKQIHDNPLKNLIQAQHQIEFKCAQIFNETVQEVYGKSFNDHELAYIALHFGTAFQK